MKKQCFPLCISNSFSDWKNRQQIAPKDAACNFSNIFLGPSQREPKVIQKRPKSYFQMTPKWSQSDPKNILQYNDPKLIQDESKTTPMRSQDNLTTNLKWFKIFIFAYIDHIWSSYMIITYDDHIWWSYVMIIYDHHI